ncbi:HypC/HybG/HupF family hydrogenase formation chaperone [uncultured Methanospirillum sp.]|uniref:HypC/HybG/HupF family hydrogenase formation chaperone n=1 Tax=uncultured Methanospirillum sp. TaxID=262503 RepID=UPI0029C6B3E4|nr:HypC/HybG/HupF family hydrogenase formation chaperone [uncultured Methanospirillum sp.]
MCIAVPAEIIEIKEGNVAVVDFGNLKQEIRVDLIDANIGDFVLVHVGFAIQKIDRDEALETRELFKQCYEAIGEEAFPA